MQKQSAFSEKLLPKVPHPKFMQKKKKKKKKALNTCTQNIVNYKETIKTKYNLKQNTEFPKSQQQC